MKHLTVLLPAMLIAAALAISAPVFADDTDAGAIRHLLMAQFDRQDSRLTVEPVTVHGNVAVAGWAQGDMGGRALLRRYGDQWQLVLCSGDTLKEARSLQRFGLSVEEAQEMARAVADAESKLDTTLVAEFSTFDGVMRMDESGNHPSVSAWLS